MKNRFQSSYTDKNDGDKIKVVYDIEVSNLTNDLGRHFVFIATSYQDPKRKVRKEICIPLKDIPKLIKALNRAMRKK